MKEKKFKLKRYFFKQWYSRKNDTRSDFCVRVGRWYSDVDEATIKDKIHVFPFVCFYFNSYEFFIGFGWLVLACWYLHVNYKKLDRWRKSRVA